VPKNYLKLQINFLYDILQIDSMAFPPDASVAYTPFGTYQFSNAYFDFMKTWSSNLSKNNISPTDWRIWLPRAFYLNWSDPQIMQKSMMDPTIWLPVALLPNKEERDHAIQHIVQIINKGVYIEGNVGDNTNVAGRDQKKEK